jgi:beta-N-acetylhexosaminidase
MTNELTALARACVLPSFAGAVAPDWIRRFVAEGGGGVMLFATNVPSRLELASLCASLRAERADLLFAIDEEGGDVTRLEWRTGSSYPGGAALGVIDDVALTESVARAIAAEVGSVGVNWNLAPVADVNVPENPVIGARAFGDDAVKVARHVAAYVRGTEGAGVAACAKHFPGHGATTQDSHLELPTVDGDVEAGLEPFRAAVAAGVRSIMTAHVRVPVFGEEPATLNPRLLRDLLREQLGFGGVIVGDALDMRAVAARAASADLAVEALSAGCDGLIMGPLLGENDVAAVCAALALRVPEARLEEAAGRMRELAAWVDPVSSDADRSVGIDAARRALTTVGDTSFALAPRVVELRATPNIAAGEAEHSLAAVVVREGEVVPEADVFVVRDAHRHQWMQAAADVTGAVVVETGIPVWRPSAARGHIVTYGGSRASYDAVAELLA